jgi:hypothetical protein
LVLWGPSEVEVRPAVKGVRFTEQYGLSRTTADDWFDPLLNVDTKLFVDPFLIFLDDSQRWANAHARLMAFFDMVMKMLAESGFKETSPLFQKARDLLLFKEPPEFCLGTSEGSIFGAGSSKGLQAGMLKGAAEGIEFGLESLKHFEELALFGEQIGPDRVGDIAGDVLKPEFVDYTQSVANRHGIPLQQVNLGTCGWSETARAWLPGLVDLPVNPIASASKGRPIGVLLTPKRFLRRHPSINGQEFWDFAWATSSETLRAEFNVEIASRVDAGSVSRLARRHRDLLSAYLDSLVANPKEPYDVDEDPDLIVKQADFDKQVANSLTVAAPASEADFVDFIQAVVANFKWCVEERGAWRVLWANSAPRRESIVQDLFQTSAVMACRDRDIDISPESDAGRGPVDFKMSRGWTLRALLEIKLAKSSSFRRNLESQVPTYAKAEGCKTGCFVVIQFEPPDFDPDFIGQAEELARKIAHRHDMAFKIVWVDASAKPSASRVTSP